MPDTPPIRAPRLVPTDVDGAFDAAAPGGHRAYVRQARAVPERGLVFSVGFDGTLRAHRLDDLEFVAAAAAHAHGAGAVTISADGRVATAGADGVVRVWSFDGDRWSLGLELRVPIDRGDPLTEALLWDPRRDEILAGQACGAVFLVDVARREARLVDDRGLINVNAFQFAADGRTLYVASDECTVRRYGREGNTWLHRATSPRLDDHVDALSLRAGPDGGLLATTHGRRLWRCADPAGDLRFEPGPAAEDALNTVSWFGRGALTGGDDHRLRWIGPDALDAVTVVDLQRDVTWIDPVDADRVVVATSAGLYVVDVPGRRVLARSHRIGAIGAVALDEGRIVVGLHDAPWLIPEGEDRDAVRLSAPVNCAARGGAVFGLTDGGIVGLRRGRPQLLGRAGAEVEALGGAVVEGRTVLVSGDRAGNLTRFDRDRVDAFAATGRGRRIKAIGSASIDGRPLVLAAGKAPHLHALWPAESRPRARVVAGPPISLRTLNGVTVADDVAYLPGWDRLVHRVRLSNRARLGRPLPPLAGAAGALEEVVVTDEYIVSTGYKGMLQAWARGGDPTRPAWTLPLSGLALRRMIEGRREGTVLVGGYSGRVFEVDLVARRATAAWTVVS